MYTAAGEGGGVAGGGGEDIFFKGENFFHIPSHNT